jgi:methyl-accepting chemotaxis protein
MNIPNRITLKKLPFTVWYLTATILLMAAVSFALQSNQSLEKSKKQISLNMDDIQSIIKDTKANSNTIRLDSDAQAIAKAHAFSYMIALKPSIVGDALELERIRKLLNVDELHIADRNGILVGSTLSSHIGYDFASSPNSKEFMLAIYYKDFELAQKPMPKGIDKTLFQYAGVARIDQPGIVQIGYKPERIEAVMKTAAIENIVKDWRIGSYGQAWLADFNGKIMSTFDGKNIGQNLTAYGFPENAFEGAKGSFTGKVRNQTGLFMYRFYDNLLIIGFVPEEEIYGNRNRNLIVMLLTGLGAVVIAMVLSSMRKEQSV